MMKNASKRWTKLLTQYAPKLESEKDIKQLFEMKLSTNYIKILDEYYLHPTLHHLGKGDAVYHHPDKKQVLVVEYKYIKKPNKGQKRQKVEEQMIYYSDYIRQIYYDYEVIGFAVTNEYLVRQRVQKKIQE